MVLLTDLSEDTTIELTDPELQCLQLLSATRNIIIALSTPDIRRCLKAMQMTIGEAMLDETIEPAEPLKTFRNGTGKV
jgi:hypothetical protein